MAPDTVNVQDALTIGSEQSKQFSASLSSDFHKTIKKMVRSMEALKKAVTVKGKAIYDIETLFSRLLVLGQQRSVDLSNIFQFELSPVAAEDAQTIRILSDDTDVFVLLVYWTSRMRVIAKIQMEKWNGDVLDINKTVERLGPRKCSQLLGVHALSGCDTVSYPFGKGKQSALKLLEIDIPGLDQVLGELGATHAQLKATADSFFFPLYGQKSCTTMNDARTRLYRSHKKPPQLKKLPPTDANLQLHVLRTHLQMLLWKAANQRDPPEEALHITNFGWSIKGSTITPTISTAPVAPQALLDVVSCSCSAEGKACSGGRCSCNRAGLSCTDYCKCEGGVACCSQFTRNQMDTEDNEEELGVDDDNDDDDDED